MFIFALLCIRELREIPNYLFEFSFFNFQAFSKGYFEEYTHPIGEYFVVIIPLNLLIIYKNI